jgi:D-3-phosphoglycerate dehydrogenase
MHSFMSLRKTISSGYREVFIFVGKSLFPMISNHHIRILLIDRPHPILTDTLERIGVIWEARYEENRREILAMLPDFHGVVMRSRFNVDREFLDAALQLRFIAREGVGLEHIDVEYAASKGIAVISSPEGSRHTVAEHTLGLMLCLMNHLARADRQVREGQWLREPNRGTEIFGKTVGVLGYGNMGSALAALLRGFGCRVIAYDKYRPGWSDPHAESVDLGVLHRESDILSIHIPYMPSNHYFVNDEFLAAFEKPIYLVNTARGLVLETAALVRHLTSGQVSGAALDVLEYEEGSFNMLRTETLPEAFHALLRLPNVVLSPHIAGWSFESKLGHARVLAKKIEDFLEIGRGKVR